MIEIADNRQKIQVGLDKVTEITAKSSALLSILKEQYSISCKNLIRCLESIKFGDCTSNEKYISKLMINMKEIYNEELPEFVIDLFLDEV